MNQNAVEDTRKSLFEDHLTLKWKKKFQIKNKYLEKIATNNYYSIENLYAISMSLNFFQFISERVEP